MTDSIRLDTGSSAIRLPVSPLPQPKAATPEQKPVVKEPEHSPVSKVDPEKMMANLREIVDRLNKQMKASNRDLGFSVDDSINTFIVTVTDSNTGEVIRQIPTDVVVKFAHSLEDLKGILFNEKL